FITAAITFQVVVQFVRRFDNWRSIQAQTVLGSKVCQNALAQSVLVRPKPSVRVVKIGDDPDAQQVITEITEWAVADCAGNVPQRVVVVAAVNCVAIRGEAPILPESRSCNAVHRKTIGRLSNRSQAGLRTENVIRTDLLERRISFKVADYILHLNSSGVG